MAIGYIIGILEGLYLHFSIVFFYVLIAIIYLIFKCICYKKRPIVWNYSRYRRYIKLCINKRSIIIFVISSIIANIIILTQEHRYKDMQTQLQSQETMKVVGTIVSNPKEEQYYTLYKLKVKQNHYFNIYIKKAEKKLTYGQAVIIQGKFQCPKVQRNKGGFDYNKYLKTQKTVGIIKVTNIEKIIMKQNILDLCNKQANKISNLLKYKIKEKIQNEEISSILIALLLGDTSYISEDITEDFRNIGIAHILAISGMHIAYLISVSNFIAIKLIGRRKAYVFTIFILISYTFITGFSPSIMRAVIMGIIMLLSKIFYTRNDALTNIGISALLILIKNPYCILDIGFQLSFGGTLGIVLFQNIIRNKKFKQFLVILIAQVFIFPISIYQFNTFCPYFILTNLIVGILIGPIMISSFLFVILTIFNSKLATLFGFIPKTFIKILLFISQISKLPFSTIYIATPKMWHFIIYFLFIISLTVIYQLYFSKRDNTTKRRFRQTIQAYKFYFKYRKPIKFKKIIIALLIFIIFFKLIYPNKLYIHFVDVGQGDCTFIETPQGKTILIDGGENSVLSYILDRGYTKIDYIIISHFDSDHVGGILEILQKIKVGQAIIGKQGENSENFIKFIEIAKKKKINVKVVKKGDRIIIDKQVYIDILWPKEELIEDNVLNNNAIVAKLNYRGITMLFTGDVEEIAEDKMIFEYKNTDFLKCNILKVAHHGSKTSSTDTFLQIAKPQIALIGVGENNKYGHPSQEILERIQSLRYEDI